MLQQLVLHDSEGAISTTLDDPAILDDPEILEVETSNGTPSRNNPRHQLRRLFLQNCHRSGPSVETPAEMYLAVAIDSFSTRV